MNLQKTLVALVVIVIGATVVPGCSKDPKSNPGAEQLAAQTAQDWLALVDGGKNLESWQQAAEYFRAAVPQEQWLQTIKAAREPLGALVSREIKSTKYTTSVPGGPDGKYVIVQFSSSFENKKTAIETVTPMMDKDNTWRVSGYYVK